MIQTCPSPCISKVNSSVCTTEKETIKMTKFAGKELCNKTKKLSPQSAKLLKIRSHLIKHTSTVCHFCSSHRTITLLPIYVYIIPKLVEKQTGTSTAHAKYCNQITSDMQEAQRKLLSLRLKGRHLS